MRNPNTIVALTAPSAWASFLINGDGSGLQPRERANALAWLAREGMPSPTHCEDAGFLRFHNALEECPFAADCQTYYFLVTKRRRA